MDADEEESTNRSSFRHEETPDDQPEALVRQDNRVVRLIRLLVLAVITCAAISTATLVYFYVRQSEIEAYERAFDGVGDRIVEAFLSDTALKFGLASTVASSISGLMSLTNTSAVNLTIPQDHWTQVFQSLILTASVRVAGWGPILRSDEERRAFEASVVATQISSETAGVPCYLCGTPTKGFLNLEAAVVLPGVGRHSCHTIDSAARSGNVPIELCSAVSALTVDVCGCVDPSPHSTQDYGQQSQSSAPLPQTVFRLDNNATVVEEPYGQSLYAPFRQVVTSSEERPHPLLEQLSFPARNAAIKHMLQTKAATMSATMLSTEPFFRKGASYDVSSVYFPVSDSTGEVVAAVALDFLWDLYITSVFPSLAQYVDVVINNTCSGSMTYNVDIVRDQMTRVGYGDLHDPAYDKMRFQSTLEDFDFTLHAFSPLANRPAEECRYSFTVYATKELENEFMSWEPIIFAVLVGAIFVFTAVVFLVYDLAVKRRQDKVMVNATKTSNIVSSLFPENVRRRIMLSNEQGGSLTSSKRNVQVFLEGKGSMDRTSAPIADLFPSAVSVSFFRIFLLTCIEQLLTYNGLFQDGHDLGHTRVYVLGQ